MSPLSIIKYIVEHLQGTPYAPLVDGLLFMILAVAIITAVSTLLGKSNRARIAAGLSWINEQIANRRGYEPTVESFRLRIEPYIEFFGTLYFAFLGLYSGATVGIAAILAMHKIPIWALLLCLLWIQASFLYMRINLEIASWAYKRIRR